MRGPGLSVCIGGFLLVVSSVLQGGVQGPTPDQSPPPPAAAAAFDVSDCKACHEKAVHEVGDHAHAGVRAACAACHGDVGGPPEVEPGDGRAGPHPLDEEDEAEGGQRRPARAATRRATTPTWTGTAHDRRGVACTDCHSVHDFKSPKAQLKTAAGARHLLHLPQRDPRPGPAHLAPPGARGPDDLLELPRPPRRQPAQDDQGRLDQRALPAVPHGEARAVPLGARAGAGELPELPQPARLEPRQAAGLAAALALPALPPEHAAPRHRLQGHQRRRRAATSASNRAVEHACKNCHQNVHGGNAPTGPYLGR